MSEELEHLTPGILASRLIRTGAEHVPGLTTAVTMVTSPFGTNGIKFPYGESNEAKGNTFDIKATLGHLFTLNLAGIACCFVPAYRSCPRSKRGGPCGVRVERTCTSL